jgi:hypothetical protein
VQINNIVFLISSCRVFNKFAKAFIELDSENMYKHKRWSVREENALLEFCKDFSDAGPAKCKQLPVIGNILRHRPCEYLRNKIKQLATLPAGSFMLTNAFARQRTAMRKWTNTQPKVKGMFDFDGFSGRYPRPDYV